jgi:hypothetical protein
VTNDYFVLPFWPSEIATSSWNYRTPTTQVWEAETTVFRSDLSCNNLAMKSKEFYVRHAGDDIEAEINKQPFLASVLLESENGCQYNLTYNATTRHGTGDQSFASWGDIRHIAKDNVYDSDARVILNKECTSTEMILMSTPWFPSRRDRFAENMTIVAHVCSSSHTMATLTVRASSSSGGLSVTFDQDAFHQTAQDVPSTMLDLMEMHNIYTDPDWYSFIPQPAQFQQSAPVLGGVAALLGTEHAYNISEMMKDSALPETAAKMRRRFFGEILQTSLTISGNYENVVIAGVRVAIERRIFVSTEVAALLCGLFSVSFCLFLVIMWLLRPKKRPLNISRDPSTVLGLSALIVSNTSVLPKFAALDLSDRQGLKTALAKEIFFTTPNVLQKANSEPRSDSDGAYAQALSIVVLISRRCVDPFERWNTIIITSSKLVRPTGLYYRTFGGDRGSLQSFTTVEPASGFIHVPYQRQHPRPHRLLLTIRHCADFTCGYRPTLVGYH